jgi:hypothetical protein
MSASEFLYGIQDWCLANYCILSPGHSKFYCIFKCNFCAESNYLLLSEGVFLMQCEKIVVKRVEKRFDAVDFTKNLETLYFLNAL